MDQWPRPDLSDYLSATTPGYHLILTVVGRQFARRHGLGAKILGALAGEQVNIEMISYGEGSINLTMLIADADIQRAVPVLHGMLFDEA